MADRAGSPKPQPFPMSRAELAVAEIGEALYGVADPASVARKAPNLAGLMRQRRELLARQQPAQAKHVNRGVLFNSDIDQRMSESA
jgi:hypothetical protein